MKFLRRKPASDRQYSVVLRHMDGTLRTVETPARSADEARQTLERLLIATGRKAVERIVAVSAREAS